MDIKPLIEKGYQQAAFKYKANAVRFIEAWKKKGYHCGWLYSSGPVVDSDGEYVREAYYCICEKEAPKPLTAKEKKESARQDALAELWRTNPKKYWTDHLKPLVMKDIDPEIRNLINDLNDNNQFTIESCAGHGADDPGRLFFDGRNLDGRKVQAIMRRHGLTGVIKKDRYLKDRKHPVVVYEFDAIGRKKR